jgi:beta-N-acetylhexosaminidase
MRYRGFTGNIRQRTAPLSLDAQAMQSLLALPEVKAWRDAGGVLVSGSLGDPLIRRYYDPQVLTFPAQRAALDALQASNDVLVLSDFGATGAWAEQLANIKSTIKFFQDKYSTDLTFQARVDDALARILRLKVRLYPGFDLSSVGRSRAVTLQVAQDALTLLAASPATSAERQGPVPTPQDSILIFTDDRLYKECATCLARPLLITDTLQQTMARLYPSRVDAARITSLTFSNLFAFLNPTTPAASGLDVGAALAAANWIVFAALDPDAAAPQSTVLKQLVAQRPGLLANKKVILFAFDAPHYLEPEVIARATAVYALYGRTDPFVEVAVRALFGDAKPQGNPPVDVDAIRYRLIVQSEPNPNQIIQLFIGDEPKEAGATPVPVEIKVGDTLKLRTGAITDRNGHPVPDGTQVTFSRTFSQSVELPLLVAPTRNGVATISLLLDRIGPLRVRASSEPAMASFTLQLTVAEQPSRVQFITPTALPPTPTLEPTVTVTSTPVPTLTPTSTPAPPPTGNLTKSYWVGLNELLLALVGVIVMGGVGYWTQRTRRRSGEADMDAASRAVRWGLWSVLAGLIGYVLYGLRAPGSLWARTAWGAWTALVVAMIFGVVPVLVGFRTLDSSLFRGERNLNRK